MGLSCFLTWTLSIIGSVPVIANGQGEAGTTGDERSETRDVSDHREALRGRVGPARRPSWALLPSTIEQLGSPPGSMDTPRSTTASSDRRAPSSPTLNAYRPGPPPESRPFHRPQFLSTVIRPVRKGSHV